MSTRVPAASPRVSWPNASDTVTSSRPNSAAARPESSASGSGSDVVTTPYRSVESTRCESTPTRLREGDKATVSE